MILHNNSWSRRNRESWDQPTHGKTKCRLLKQAALHRPYHNCILILALPIAYLGNTSNCFGWYHEMIWNDESHSTIRSHLDSWPLSPRQSHPTSISTLGAPGVAILRHFTFSLKWQSDDTVCISGCPLGTRNEYQEPTWYSIHHLIIYWYLVSMNLFRPS